MCAESVVMASMLAVTVVSLLYFVSLIVVAVRGVRRELRLQSELRRRL